MKKRPKFIIMEFQSTIRKRMNGVNVLIVSVMMTMNHLKLTKLWISMMKTILKMILRMVGQVRIGLKNSVIRRSPLSVLVAIGSLYYCV